MNWKKCIKFPLLQAIKETNIFAKTIKELCVKKPRSKRKGIQNVQLIEKFADIMIGKLIKYLDWGSPIVKIHINGIEIPNTLIGLGAPINIMTRNTMDKLRLTNLQYTPTLLQIANIIVIKPKVILEDVYVSLDSWEYPRNLWY